MRKFFSLYTVLIIIFLIISLATLNQNLRKKIITNSLGIINNYYLITIEYSLKSKDNYQAINKLKQQIKISEFLINETKNSFLDNIYANAYKIEKFIKTKDEYLKFSEIIKKLISKEPNIYDAILWDAKLMLINNEDQKKIIKQIDRAIELSPINIEAYRFALDLSYKLDKKDLLKKYCFGYHNSLLGGRKEKNIFSMYEGSYATRFAIQIISTNHNNEFINQEGLKFNSISDFKFALAKPKKLKGINLIGNFPPGIIIDILNFSVINSDSEIINLPLNNIFLSSKNSFFQQSNKSVKIITTSKNDEKISMMFDNEILNVTNIYLKLKFSKLNLTNIPNC